MVNIRQIVVETPILSQKINIKNRPCLYSQWCMKLEAHLLLHTQLRFNQVTSFYEKKLFIYIPIGSYVMELFFFFFFKWLGFQKRISLVPLSSIVSENKIEIYYVISAYSCLNCEFQCCSSRGAFYTILCFLSGQISDEWKQKNTTKWSPSRGEATHLIRPVFHCRRDGFIRGGPPYSSFLFIKLTATI